MNKYLFIINPSAGKYQAEKSIPEIERLQSQKLNVCYRKIVSIMISSRPNLPSMYMTWLTLLETKGMTLWLQVGEMVLRMKY